MARRHHWTQTPEGRKQMARIARMGGRASARKHNGGEDVAPEPEQPKATNGTRGRPGVVSRIRERIEEIDTERRELVTALDVHERYAHKV